jgi:hypothetical protein
MRTRPGGATAQSAAQQATHYRVAKCAKPCTLALSGRWWSRNYHTGSRSAALFIIWSRCSRGAQLQPAFGHAGGEYRARYGRDRKGRNGHVGRPIGGENALAIGFVMIADTCSSCSRPARFPCWCCGLSWSGSLGLRPSHWRRW